MKKLLLLALATLLVSTTRAQTIVTVPGTPYQTPSLTDYATYGNEMAGMQVWAKFSDGTTQSAVWTADGATSGNATAAGFKVWQSGDTFNSDSWHLQNLATGVDLKQFGFHGSPGDTVFDIAFTGGSTPGSESGKTFSISTNGYPATATYSNIVNLTGFPAVGDLYESLSVDFDPIAPGASITFSQDTDQAAVRGSITPVPDTGATLGLITLSLLALGVLRRRLA